MKLFKHQQDIVNDNKLKVGLFLGTGGGKTLTAIMLAEGKTLVICPKILREDKTWERNLKKSGKKLDLTVLSKEDFKKQVKTLKRFNTVILDEVHLLSGIRPSVKWVKKIACPDASQLYDLIINYLTEYPPNRLYPLTATPIRTAMSVYGVGKMLGKDWDFYQFRSIFYMPVFMNFRERWLPKKDVQSQEKLGKLVRSLGYTGQLSDWFDVPEQTHKIINVELTAEQKKKLKELPIEFPDPLVLVGKKHQVEQGVLKGNQFEPSQTFKSGKIEVIQDLILEYPKVLIFAKYTEHINQIAKEIIDRPVYILDGNTKDRENLIKNAENDTRCVVIAQSGISAGYELKSIRCTIFASESYSIVDHIQGIGRTLRSDNLQKNLYVYLVSGEIDKAVRKSIELKNTFSEAIYSKLI